MYMKVRKSLCYTGNAFQIDEMRTGIHFKEQRASRESAVINITVNEHGSEGEKIREGTTSTKPHKSPLLAKKIYPTYRQ